MINFLFDNFNKFWKQHPFLGPSLSVFLGISYGITHQWFYFIPLVGLLISSLRSYRFIIYGFLFILSIATLFIRYEVSIKENQTEEGLIFVRWNQERRGSGPFGSQWIYSGKLLAFYSGDKESSKTSGIPCLLYSSTKLPLSSLNYSYATAGKVTLSPQGKGILKVSKKSEWIIIKEGWGLNDWRSKQKKWFSSYLSKYYPEKKVKDFLFGITCGEFNDSILGYHFNQLGLQHILAISGFHFSILAFFIGLIIQRFFPFKLGTTIILLLIGGYFLFLGPSPSIQRAWLNISLGLLGGLLNYTPLSLNILGACLGFLCLYDPYLSQTLGFQLSFLATGSILLFYKPVEEWLGWWFPSRSWREAQEVPVYSQHLLFIILWTKKALALTFSAHILTLPVVWYFFQSWSPLSLLFNLVFPFFFSISLCLLLLGFFSSFIFSWFGVFFHWVNYLWTNLLLDCITVPPGIVISYNFSLFSEWTLCILLVFLFLYGTTLNTKQTNKVKIFL